MFDALLNHPASTALASAFAAAGHCLFLVGGSVRNALSGQGDFDDLDYTTDARPEQILQLVAPLGSSWRVGEAFGTIGVQIAGVKVEVTTFRTETYTSGSRHPQVTFGDTIGDDLRRRDLIINAAALCLVGDGTWQAGQLADPFGAAADLAAGVLRTPDRPEVSMTEDPLRQLRVVRFAAIRNLRVSHDLARAVVDNGALLQGISVERRTAELRKILKAGPAATVRALNVSRVLLVDEYLFGPFTLGLTSQTPIADLPGDADPTTIMALMVLGPPGLITHEFAELRQQLRAMTWANAESAPALDAAAAAARLLADPVTLVAARRLVRDCSPETLRRALCLANVWEPQSPLPELVRQVSGDTRLRQPLPINGTDLLEQGLAGPRIGAGLRQATDAFLSDPQLGREELLTAALR